MTSNLMVFLHQKSYFRLYTVVTLVQKFFLSSIDKGKKSTVKKTGNFQQ